MVSSSSHRWPVPQLDGELAKALAASLAFRQNHAAATDSSSGDATALSQQRAHQNPTTAPDSVYEHNAGAQTAGVGGTHPRRPSEESHKDLKS